MYTKEMPAFFSVLTCFEQDPLFSALLSAAVGFVQDHHRHTAAKGLNDLQQLACAGVQFPGNVHWRGCRCSIRSTARSHVPASIYG